MRELTQSELEQVSGGLLIRGPGGGKKQKIGEKASGSGRKTGHSPRGTSSSGGIGSRGANMPKAY